MKIRKCVDNFLSTASVLLLAVMVVAVTYQVIMRYIFSSPSSITESVILVSFMGMILFGGAYTAGQHKHLSIDILISKVNPQNKRRLEIVLAITMVFFASLFLIYGGFVLVSKAYANQQMHSGLRIQMYYILLALPLSGLCMLFYGIHDLYLSITKKEA